MQASRGRVIRATDFGFYYNCSSIGSDIQRSRYLDCLNYFDRTLICQHALLICLLGLHTDPNPLIRVKQSKRRLADFLKKFTLIVSKTAVCPRSQEKILKQILIKHLRVLLAFMWNKVVSLRTQKNNLHCCLNITTSVKFVKTLF